MRSLRRLLALLALAAGLSVLATAPAQAQTPDCLPAVDYDPTAFTQSTTIDNQFLPLIPGTQMVLEGRASRNGPPLPHRVTFTVTDLVKVIDGVRTRVMWDVDEQDGELAEAELAFFAQDDAGNVWSLGEYPEEYEDGFFIGAPSTWIHGVADAEGGIHMLNSPSVGATYLQGSVPSIQFLDCAEVFAEEPEVCLPTGCYQDVLVTHETSPPDPAIQTKAHAPGVGIVEVGAINDLEAETLVLVERNQLDAAGLDAAREAALTLDVRAYRTASVVYGGTPPLGQPRQPPPPPPVPPVAPLPPPLPPPPPPLPPPDLVAPEPSLGRARPMPRLRGLTIAVTCPAESCTVSASGRISLPGAARTFRLSSRPRSLAAGASGRLTLRFGSRLRTALMRHKRRGRHVRAALIVTAADAAGNSASERRRVRLF